MNPWGTMNDWLRLEVDERVRHYGLVRRSERGNRQQPDPSATAAAEPRVVPTLSRDDVTVCA